MNPTPTSSSSHSRGYGYTDSTTTSSGHSGAGYSSSVGGGGAGLGFGGAIPPSPFSYYSSAYFHGGMNPPSPYLDPSFGQYAAMAMMNRGHNNGHMPSMYPSASMMGMGAPTYLPLMPGSYNAYPYGYGAHPFAPAPYMWPPPMSIVSLMGNAYPPAPTVSSYHQEFRAIAPACSSSSGSSAPDTRSHSEDAGIGNTRTVQQSRPQSAEELVNSQILLDSIIRNDNSRSTSHGRGANGHDSGTGTNDDVNEVDVTTAEEEDDFPISQYHQRQFAVTQRDGQPLRRSPRRRQTVLPTPTVQEAPQRKRRYVRRNKPRGSNKGNAAKKACPEIPLDSCTSSAPTSNCNSQASSSRPSSQPKARGTNKASDGKAGKSGKNFPDTDVSIFVREDVSEQTSRLWNVPASGPASEGQTTAATSSLESFPTEQERKKYSALPVPLVLLKNLKNHVTPEKPSPRAPLSFSDRKLKMGYPERDGRDLIDIIEKEHLKQMRTPAAAAAQVNIQQNPQQANLLEPKDSSRSSSPQAVGLHGLFSRDLDPPENMFDICRPLYTNAPNSMNKIPEEDPSAKAKPNDKRPRKGRPAKKRSEFIKFD